MSQYTAALGSACLGCIAFFLLHVSYAIAFAQTEQCLSQTAETDLRELLICFLAKVNAPCEVRIVATYNCSYLILYAMVDDATGGLSDVILHSIIAFSRETIESMSHLLSLFVRYALKSGFLLVPILVD